MPSLFVSICFLVRGLGPYIAAQAMDLPVINLDSNKGSFVRFQIPQNDQITSGARVSTTVWDQNPTQVTNTCLDFCNHGGINIQLWRKWDLSTLFYAGILVPTPNGCFPA